MTPELKLAFQQKIYSLHINSSMGVDEKNIAKILDICIMLKQLAGELYFEVYPEEVKLTVTPGYDLKSVYPEKFEMPENDVVEATKELNTRVKPHRPEVK